MKSLWFKQCYVEDILAGRKTDTIRKSSSHVPKPGQIVAFSIGARKPFATAEILSVESVAQISEHRLDDLREIYGTIPDNLLCITFRLR
jgi:hypothetical protein